jgi:hypothetical protein
VKNLLRRWLGIVALEKTMGVVAVEAAGNRPVDNDQLRKEIATCLDFILRGAPRDHEHWSLWSPYFQPEPGMFEHTLKRVTEKHVSEKVSELVDSRIGTEAFIDEVVARIRRKQIKGQVIS